MKPIEDRLNSIVTDVWSAVWCAFEGDLGSVLAGSLAQDAINGIRTGLLKAGFDGVTQPYVFSPEGSGRADSSGRPWSRRE